MEPEKPKLDYETPKQDENRSTRMVLKGLLGAVVGFVLAIAGIKIYYTFNPPVQGTMSNAVELEEILFASIVVGVLCGVIWEAVRDGARRR